MYKDIIFWATEYLNYFSLIFWGIKLFLKKYNVETKRKEWVENFIIIVVSIPVVWFCADNYKFVVYSNPLSYFIVLYMYVYIKVYTKGKIRHVLSLIGIYVNTMRLVDLFTVTIIFEINRISRFAEWDLIHMGIDRSVFMVLLSLCYYIFYRLLVRNKLIEYLKENAMYRYGMFVYSFFGILSFCRVYRFEYSERLIQYWIFYLVCAFIMYGLFLFYIIQVKGEEKNRILNLRNDLLEANYQALKKAYDENRVLSHDFRNHIMAISHLIQEQRNDEALKYIRTYIEAASVINYRVESGCEIMDIIINCKIAEAAEKNIRFVYKIDYVGNICIEDIDICALLANLLDNSIEACEIISNKDRWIYLKIKQNNNMLLIWASNSIVESKKESINFFQSAKKDQVLHGLGMKSIDNVIKKYDGYKEYDIQENRFQIFISLPIY